MCIAQYIAGNILTRSQGPHKNVSFMSKLCGDLQSRTCGKWLGPGTTTAASEHEPDDVPFPVSR
jgi:hypothetical protein